MIKQMVCCAALVFGGAGLMLPVAALAGDGCSSCTAGGATASLYDVAKKDGKFNTLTAAIAAAGLDKELAGGEYTLFAPTDEAFSKLPPATLDALLKPENSEKLKAVLAYHVVKGRTSSCDLKAGDSAATLQGSPLNVKVNEGQVTVNGANVGRADIAAKNGVIHAIDTVLLPQGVL